MYNDKTLIIIPRTCSGHYLLICNKIKGENNKPENAMD